MRRPLLLVLGLLVALLLTAWLIWPNYRQQRAIARQLTKATESPSRFSNLKSQIPRPTPPAPATGAFPLNSPTSDIRADLRLVAETIETFRSNFPRDGNPTGTNAEITAALTGKNPVRFAFLPPNHPAINRDGELCDRWGTPFFFHAESSTRMEIRSAGPDKKLWTEDDITYE